MPNTIELLLTDNVENLGIVALTMRFSCTREDSAIRSLAAERLNCVNVACRPSLPSEKMLQLPDGDT